MPKKINVFVSSTSEDLRDYRAVARNVILEMGWHPEMMEYMGAAAKPTVAACCDLLESCQLVVLIVAWRRGWVPSKNQGGNGSVSVTALELDHAREKNIPVLIFLANDSWPVKLLDRGASLDWVEAFRNELNQPAVFFEYEANEQRDFYAKLRQQLTIFERGLEEDQDTGGDYFDSARSGLITGKNIPFIGTGIYSDGPLSTSALVAALAPELDRENITLAAAAEYREGRDRTRTNFLETFGGIIRQQSELAPHSVLYELIAKLEYDQRRVIVSATFDNLLERQLDKAGVDYTVVTHILHSFDARNVGRILVLRRDEPASICLADELDLSDAECVIYKPLGSPLLHESLDEDLELDSVVVTESDHLTFLRLLDHADTQIPTHFVRLLRRRPLLFLGYGLDFWHFRLVMKVFRSICDPRRQISPIAVRDPVSDVEAAAWHGLGTDLIRLEPEVFAKRIAEGLETA
ncbi:MAG: DUF4062 domain-containing protein [Gammaproteobacteria bacterium]|nr:DUF4062 domain-containing protein [Gammaproteobacteria bacterium]